MENEIKFPRYCCFGKLQNGSVCETADQITAEYKMFGYVVHRLTYSKKNDNWQLEDFDTDGSRQRWSFNKTLDKTICSHMIFIDDKTDKLFELLRNELFKMGNIWLNSLPAKGEGTHITYSPAGLLMTVRLLLSERGDIDGNLEKLKVLPIKIGSDCPTILEKLCSYETNCIIQRQNDKQLLLRAVVAEFIVPLAFVYDAAKWLYENCISGDNRIDRIIIDSVSPDPLKVQGFYFATPDKSGETSFVVIFKWFMMSNQEFSNRLEVMREKYGV